jgi:hypothetical protein
MRDIVSVSIARYVTSALNIWSLLVICFRGIVVRGARVFCAVIIILIYYYLSYGYAIVTGYGLINKSTHPFCYLYHFLPQA